MMHKPHNPHEGEDKARLIVAVVISLGILMAYNFFVDKPRMEALKKQQAQVELAATKAKVEVAPVTKIVARDVAIAESARVMIKGSKVHGSLSLKGARIDDLLIDGHYTDLDKKENVPLLTPSGADYAFYTESGWLSDATTLSLPTAESVWAVKAGGEVVAGGAPVTLIWDNGQGLIFERDISLDDNYLFTIVQRVKNNTGTEIKLNPYHVVARRGMPVDFKGFFVLHEGPIAYINKESFEPQYKDVLKGMGIDQVGVKGWVGITDKYWMVTVLPKPDAVFNARITATQEADQKPQFQTDAVGAALTIAAGTTIDETSYIYAGVKKLDVMKAYEKKYGFDQLERGIDFGMWFFITKPFFYLFHMLDNLTGNIALAILLMTVIVRGAVYPLASKSYRSMAKMKIVGPALKEIQEKHKGDKAAMQIEIFDLYKRENVNPFSGCWPMLIQIPIFFALYKVILISVELRHAPFWGWIRDLSAPDPTSAFNLFGLIPWTPPAPLMIGVWPLLFGLSMIVQKRISPPMPDETQEKLQSYFPYIVTVMMAHFAVGLVIYWTWSNIIGTLQQYYILKKVGGEETSLIRGHATRRKKKVDDKK